MIRIAVIISLIEESCQAMIRQGIVSLAAEKGIALTTFTVSSLDNDTQIHSHFTMFQPFMNSKHFDGVIFFSGAMSGYTSSETLTEYCKSIELPLVTISGNTGYGTNIIINNRSGILDAISHLAEVHNRRRIAFIAGCEDSEDAIERFEAYREGLKLNNIEYMEELVKPGDFSEWAGRAATKELIESQTQFDAIICVDDYTALGALRELEAHNISVPQAVSVFGFDNIPESAMITPSLSTVLQPFALLGSSALETVLSQIGAKEKVDDNVIMVNTHGIYRSSCGCTSEEIQMFRENWHAERSLTTEEVSLPKFLYQIQSLLAHQMISLNITGIKAVEYLDFIIGHTELLWNAFFNEINTNSPEPTFLDILTVILDKNKIYTDQFTVWQCILSNITPFSFMFDTRNKQLLAGAILHEARIALDTREKTTIQINAYDKASRQEFLRESCTSIIIASSHEDIIEVVANELLQQGFVNAAMVLINPYAPIMWEDLHLPPQMFTQFIIQDGERMRVRYHETHEFSSTEFIPPEVKDSFSQMNLILMPLYMNLEYYGYLLFEQIPDASETLYTELQIHASSAYRSCYMFEKLRAMSMNDELTGLSNRRGFMLLAKQLHAQSTLSGKNLILFYFDLDNLKKINDNYSHEDGDKAIKAAASLLKRTFRNHDILGRMGGDEFVAIIEESVSGIDIILKQRLQEMIKTFNPHSGLPYAVEMSIGSTVLKYNDSSSIEEGLRLADEAMFENKKARKMGRDS